MHKIIVNLHKFFECSLEDFDSASCRNANYENRLVVSRSNFTN
jgi:hypothetical protein